MLIVMLDCVSAREAGLPGWRRVVDHLWSGASIIVGVGQDWPASDLFAGLQLSVI